MEYIYGYDSGYNDGYAARDGEIVRCGDCANLNDANKCPCAFYALEDPDGFCAWGARRA